MNVIDPDNNEKIADIQVDNGPRGIAFVDELNKVYVINSDEHGISNRYFKLCSNKEYTCWRESKRNQGKNEWTATLAIIYRISSDIMS